MTLNNPEQLKAPFPWFESFVSKIDMSGYCWEWTAAKNEKGYGIFCANGKTRKAHRIAYELWRGPIPNNLCLLHKCDNPGCVRPDHLTPGTRSENNEDMCRKGRHRPGGTKTSVALCKYKRGNSHHAAKLNMEKVVLIRSDYASGDYSMSQVARKYAIALTTAFKVIRRKTWNHVQ